MKTNLREYANRAFKIGQINGKAFVIKHYLENALIALDFDRDDADLEGYIKDALKGIEEISKLTKQI